MLLWHVYLYGFIELEKKCKDKYFFCFDALIALDNFAFTLVISRDAVLLLSVLRLFWVENASNHLVLFSWSINYNQLSNLLDLVPAVLWSVMNIFFLF